QRTSLRSFSSLDGVSSCVQLPSTPDFVRGVYEFRLGWFRPCNHELCLLNEFWDSSMLLQKRKLTTIAERTALLEEHTTNVMASTFKQDLIVREEFIKQERNKFARRLEETNLSYKSQEKSDDYFMPIRKPKRKIYLSLRKNKESADSAVSKKAKTTKEMPYHQQE
ncbi:17167_t:CDS:2, partial [Acaulospora morrowiae]